MKMMNKGMHRILLLSMFYGYGSLMFAQTGIGTSNPQGAFHVDGSKDNASVGIPTATQIANDFIINKTTGFIGVGVLNPQVKLDMRSVATENALGLGVTTMAAVDAGAGAVRYDVIHAPVGAKIEVSNGSVWNKAYVAPQKAVVVVRKISSQLITQNLATTITNWNVIRDMSGSFSAANGEFMAPRDGTYTFLLTFNFNSTVINDDSRVESQFYNPASNTVLASVYKTFGQSMTGTAVGNTDKTAAQAGSGALRYVASPAIGVRGYLEFSDGTNWVSFYPKGKPRIVVMASKSTQDTYVFESGTPSEIGTKSGIVQRRSSYLTNWTEILDSDSGVPNTNFNPATGEFVAPRAGVYFATFTFALLSSQVNTGSNNQTEAIWEVRNPAGTITQRVKTNNGYSSDTGSSPNKIPVGSACTVSVYLNKGDKLRPFTWTTVAFSDSTVSQFDTSSSGVYNALTIVEQ